MMKHVAREKYQLLINCNNNVSNGAPFGGYKKSGYGREVHWMILEAYTQVKSIRVNLLEQPYGDQF